MRTSGTPAEQDVLLSLELIVERVARLVLHAHSLAERTEQLDSTPGRDERHARLRRCVEVGCRVLQAAVRIDVADPTTAQPHDDRAGEHRAGEHRAGDDRAGDDRSGDRRRAERRRIHRPVRDRDTSPAR